MFNTSQPGFVQPTFPDYFPQPAFVNQQISDWGYFPGTDPFDASAAPISHDVLCTSFYEPTNQELQAMLNGPFGSETGLLEETHFTQSAIDDQVPFSTLGPFPEPHMIAPSQPFPAPQATLVEPTPFPQPLQPAPPVQAGLSPDIAMEEAVRVNDKLMLFRLNQKHRPGIFMTNSRLIPYPRLRLKRGMMEEYQAVIQEDIPLFIVQQRDWDTAFGLLGECAFHVFRMEELQNAKRRGVTLPPLDEPLELYVQMYPLHEQIEHCLGNLRGVIGGHH
ncbi:hypothetical protein OPQ81_010788 [Rhizoctonia solani]|nr:hypothetical protein OPQ81_010788 [Rhizoctonia solani]